MANITTSGTTGYPGVIDTRTALTDGSTGDQIVANHPNGLGAAVIAVETALGTTPQGTAADVVTRLNVSQNADGTIRSSVIAAGTGAGVGYSSGVFTISFSGDGPSFSQNYGLMVRVNTPVANQMTIWLQQADLSTPTTALPCRFSVRNASTLTSGTYSIVVATQQTSLVVTGGSTLGMVANEIGRLYLGIVVNNSVPELCIWNPKTWVAFPTSLRLTQLYRPNETEYVTTVAEGGAGGADNAATLYSTTLRASVPMRIIGYMDIQAGAVAGNWSNSPLTINLVGPQTKITGDVVQRIATSSVVAASTTTTVPADNTPPLIGEGRQCFCATITATSQVNPIAIRCQGPILSSTAGDNNTLHLHVQDSSNTVTNAVCAVGFRTTSADAVQACFEYVSATNSGGATGFYVIGGAAAGTFTFNGGNAVSLYGGSNNAYMTIEEIAS